jgi:uroporphyrinogen decarboxylase
VQGKELKRIPVWAMRQAGRYLPEFRAAREGIDFFECIKMVDKVVDITIQPIRRFELDAAIIFQDILNVPEAMGMKALMKPGQGPTFEEPLASPGDMTKLKTVLTNELDYFYESLFATRIRLNGVVPLFGFSGGPWTLACYMIEGGGSKSYTKVKTWMYKWPEEFKELLSILTNILIDFLDNQIKAGAQLLQLFESHMGELTPEAFTEFVLPCISKISEEIKT